MALTDIKTRRFHFVVRRNGFEENVTLSDESKWLAMARLRQLYPGAQFSLLAGGKK